MSSTQAFLNRFRLALPGCGIKAKVALRYPVSETHSTIKFFDSLEEAEAFKQQKIQEYLKPKPLPPLPTPTVNVARWSTKLEHNINQSLKTVEFFYVWSRTAGKDLSAFLARYENQLKLETEWVNTSP